MSPRVNLPEEPASVTRDPEEIALLVGQPLADAMLTTSAFNSEQKVNPTNWTKAFSSAYQSKQSDGDGTKGEGFGTNSKMMQAVANDIASRILKTKTSKFQTTGHTSDPNSPRRRTKKSPDNDDAVLIDDNSSNEGSGIRRVTPMEQRKPKVVFFQDPDIVDEYKRLKEAQIQRLKADSRNEIP